MARFLLDAGVARSVGRTLSEAGHEVVYASEALPEKSPDQMVCAAAITNRALIVAHDKDMKAMSNLDKFKNLGFLMLYCDEAMASKRVKHLMSLIEHEIAACEQKQARRFFLEIHKHAFRSHR